MKMQRWFILNIAIVAAAIQVSTGTCQAADNTSDAQPVAAAAANTDVAFLAAALVISRHSSELAAIGSMPTQLSMTRESLAGIRAAVAGHKTALSEQLATLKGRGFDDRVHYIETLVNQLIANVDTIQQGRPVFLRKLAESASNRRALAARNFLGLFPAVVTSEDELFDQMMTNFLEARRVNTGSTSRDDVLRYVHMSDLAASVALAHTFLSIASVSQNPTFVARHHENYGSLANRIERNIEYLSDGDVSELEQKVIHLTQQMLDEASGENNYFDRLVNRLQLLQNERTLIGVNAEIIDQIQDQISALAAEAQGLDASPVPTASPADPPDPGISDDQILFGQSAAFSGPAKALGQAMNLGVEAAFHEVNQANGVHGRLIKLTTLDDGYESDVAFERTLQLIRVHQVFGLIGAVGTPTSRAASPLTHAAGVPFIGPFTGAQFLRADERTNVLNFRASYYQETEKMVDLLAEAGVTRVAVLYQNDSFGIDGLTGVRNALAGQDDMEEVASWYYMRNTGAVKSAAFRIAEAKPEAVIIIGAYAPATEIIESLRLKLDPDPIFMAVSFVGSNALAEALGDDGEGVYVTQVVPLPNDGEVPVVAQYLKALSAYKSDAVPGFISLEGYIAGRLAIARLQACGPDVSRECFLNAVNDPTTIDINGLQLQYGPGDNQGSDAVFLTRIGSDGEFEQVEKLAGAP